MALDFPASPVNGQTYGDYYYDSGIGAWRNLGSKNALSSAVTTLQSDVANRKVLQVINGQTTTSTSLSGSTFTDLTGMTATITPKSTTSKILVLIALPVEIIGSGSGNAFANGKILKNGADLFTVFAQVGNFSYVTDMRSNINATYLDSPATTSALTYKVQGNSSLANSVYYVPSGNVGSITLIEIAA